MRSKHNAPAQIASIIEQGHAWINGQSVHNKLRDECCPDFSCCVPKLFEQDRGKRIAEFNRWAAKHGVTKWVDS